MNIHIMRCNDRFPGVSAATGSISEEANGWLPEMAAKAKERISASGSLNSSYKLL
jgi:hypothetical protein